jgi:hypothetical protein
VTGLRRGGFGEFSFGGGRVHDFEDEALAEGVGGAGDGGEGDGGVFGIEQAVELGAAGAEVAGQGWLTKSKSKSRAADRSVRPTRAFPSG